MESSPFAQCLNVITLLDYVLGNIQYLTISGNANTDGYLGLGCPKGWIARRTRSHDFCYLLDSKARTWPEAQNVCGTRRANLLNIRSKEEYKFIKDNVQKGMSVWIGANDRSREGVWQWLDR